MKYKHKKTGKVFIPTSSGDKYKLINASGTQDHEVVPKYLVEESSDFERMEDKQYEVLVYKYDDESKIYLCSNGLYGLNGHNGDGVISDIGIYSTPIIYSVRRLCDGEVFTLGNIIESGSFRGVINSIEINNEFSGGLALITKSITSSINSAKKFTRKEPILITKDGVIITDPNQKVYCVTGDPLYFIYEGSAINLKNSTHLVYADEAKRDEYRLMNEPLLSVNEVIEIVDQHMEAFTIPAAIIKLAKEKTR